MPGWGLIPDSPWIYYGQKLSRGRGPRYSKSGRSSFNIGYGYGSHKVIIYKPILNFELKHRYGMVSRHLHQIANRISQDAKRQVHVKTGALRDSIKIQHLNIRTEAAVKIGSNLPYAYLHHQGTRPHRITPNPPNKVLVFSRGSKVIATQVVNHPGTRPNRYLSDQLRVHVRR